MATQKQLEELGGVVRKMTTLEFSRLSPGDLVRHREGQETWLVTGNYGGRVTVVRSADITNPEEWELVSKAVRY